MDNISNPFEFDNLTELILHLETGVSINESTADGSTLLHRAAKSSNLDIVKYLIDHDAEINKKDGLGRTPLHVACEQTIVQWLLSSGADINIKDNDGQTPLYFAAKNGNSAVTKRLIECGADVNAENKNGETALWKAIEHGVANVDIIYLLLSNGGRLTYPASKESSNYGDIDYNPLDGSSPLAISLTLSDYTTASFIINWAFLSEFVNNDGLLEKALEVGSNIEVLFDTVYINQIEKIQCLRFLGESLNSSCELNLFQKACMKEIDLMKSSKHGSCSVYSVLSKYHDPYFVINSSLDKEIDHGQEKYTIYHSLLHLALFMAKKRYKLMNELVEYSLKNDNVNILSRELKWKVLTYLSDDDLKRILKALKSSQVINIETYVPVAFNINSVFNHLSKNDLLALDKMLFGDFLSEPMPSMSELPKMFSK